MTLLCTEFLFSAGSAFALTQHFSYNPCYEVTRAMMGTHTFGCVDGLIGHWISATNHLGGIGVPPVHPNHANFLNPGTGTSQRLPAQCSDATHNVTHTFVYDGWNRLTGVGTTGSVVCSYGWSLDWSQPLLAACRT